MAIGVLAQATDSEQRAAHPTPGQEKMRQGDAIYRNLIIHFDAAFQHVLRTFQPTRKPTTQPESRSIP
ncbi:MAG: hypothetical protein WBD62_04555 [Anaerolineales bacterium]